MPIRMKSKRELTFEKLMPDDAIPKATFVLDNVIRLYANYFPPGQHFFYFVWEDGKIFLSPNYDICRFKTTNIFLNRIEVKPRIMDFDAVYIVKGGDEDEAVFLLSVSAFDFAVAVVVAFAFPFPLLPAFPSLAVPNELFLGLDSIRALIKETSCVNQAESSLYL